MTRPAQRRGLVAFASGLLFALGLATGGMTDPANIIGFLDVTGDFRPALLFVMVGAIGVNALAYRWVRRRGAPLFFDRLVLPTRRDIDARLVSGSALFGIGWGLAGYCPGPAVVSLVTGSLAPIVFVLAMLAGGALVSILERAREQASLLVPEP